MRKDASAFLVILFWSNAGAFCLHLFDETFIGGGFVAGVQRHFWPAYAANKFLAVNAVLLVLIAAGNALYHWQGSRLILLPAVWVWERFLNCLWHVVWTIHFKEYSPGLVTSGLFFAIFCLLYHYGVRQGRIKPAVFYGAGLIAFLLEVLLLSSLWWARKI